MAEERKMRISTHTGPFEERLGHVGAVRLICEAGFDAIDYTMYRHTQPIFTGERERMIREMKSVADNYGVVFNQAHSTNPSQRYGEENRELNERLYDCVMTSVEVASELGASQIVVHPIYVPGATREEQREINLDFYSDVLERARAVGVRIAIENMWAHHPDKRGRIIPNVCSTGEELAEYVDMLDSEYVTACLDVGHAGLVGESADGMIRALGSRLGALHIHDNDFYSDAHTLPYFGDIDFDKIYAALREIGYSGDVTFEADNILRKLPIELAPASLSYLRAIGEFIRSKIS